MRTSGNLLLPNHPYWVLKQRVCIKFCYILEIEKSKALVWSIVLSGRAFSSNLMPSSFFFVSETTQVLFSDDVVLREMRDLLQLRICQVFFRYDSWLWRWSENPPVAPWKAVVQISELKKKSLQCSIVRDSFEEIVRSINIRHWLLMGFWVCQSDSKRCAARYRVTHSLHIFFWSLIFIWVDVSLASISDPRLSLKTRLTETCTVLGQSSEDNPRKTLSPASGSICRFAKPGTNQVFFFLTSTAVWACNHSISTLPLRCPK